MHELHRHAVVGHLTDAPDGQPQMSGQSGVSPPLNAKPCFEFHTSSLDYSKPKRQDFPKHFLGSLGEPMDRLTEYRKSRLAALINTRPYDGNQMAFAKKAGLSKGRISQLLDPEASFGERSARSISTKLRLGERYFEEGFDADNETPPFVEVKRVDVRLSAGNGSVADQHEEIGSLAFRRDFLLACGVTPANAAVVSVKGTSMEPTIPNGSVLLINRNNREPRSGHIFARGWARGNILARMFRFFLTLVFRLF